MMEFLVVYEVTKMEKYEMPTMMTGTRIFVQKDVNDIHVYRMQKGINKRYNDEDGVYMVEWDKLDKFNALLGEDIFHFLEENDDYSNWDNDDYDDEEEALESIYGDWTLSETILEAPANYQKQVK